MATESKQERGELVVIGGHGAPMKDTAKDDLRAQMGRVYKA